MISKQAIFLKKALGSIRLKNIATKLMLNPKRKDRYSAPPKSFYKRYDINSYLVGESKCVSLKSNENPPRHILYFHGGGYTMEAFIAHWHLVDHVLEQTDSEVTFVNYPLAPQSKCLQTIELVSSVYESLFTATEQEIILMGDSAGGGLALALAQHIKAQKKLPQPAKIVMLSPWLDISMSSDISPELASSDKLLEKQTLIEAGKMYAGDLSTKHPLCSPLFGDLADIGEIALFIGESEILNVQAKALKDKMQQSGASLFYREYMGMPHVWMAFPIPEAKEAMREVCAFINKSGTAE